MLTDAFPERYINPYTDFGFKLLFGTPMNKDLLIGFLNSLLHLEHEITDVTYLNTEHLSMAEWDRKAVFDVYCENTVGEKFIVEMQKAGQKFFKDRSVYYASFPIREQAKRGDWDYELKAVYTIGILNFVFDEDRDDENYFHHEVKLMDVHRKEVFYDKLTFIYLEMPKFRKSEDELVTPFDKWMFVLHNLSRLLERPAALQERVFTRLFEAAEIAKFTPQKRMEYEESLKVYRDLTNVIDTAKWKGREEGRKEGREEGRKEGREEGIKKGKLEDAENLLRLGVSPEIISKATGLSLKAINDLKMKLE